MKAKIYWGILFLVILCLGGCSPEQSESIEAYLGPPKLSSELEGLNEIVKRYIEQGYNLYVPRDVKERETVFFRDINGNGVKEALVFLKDKNKNSHLLEVSYQNKIWQENSFINLSASDVVWFETEDLDRDGNWEVYITTEDENIASQMLLVFEKEDEKLVSRWSKSMKSTVIGSIGEPQIHLYMVLEDMGAPQQNEGKVYVYAYRDKRYQRIAGIDIEDYFYGPWKSQIGYIFKDKKALILDLGIGAHSGKTEIILYEKGRWFNGAEKMGDASESLLFQTYPRASQDIDKDGIIEFSVPRPTAGDEENPLAETNWVDHWHQLDENYHLKEKLCSVMNPTIGYQFLFPEKWFEQNQNIRVEMNRWNEVEPYMDFYIYDKGEKTPLYWVYFIDKAQYPLELFEGQEKIMEDETYYILRESFELPARYQFLEVDIEDFRQKFLKWEP